MEWTGNGLPNCGVGKVRCSFKPVGHLWVSLYRVHTVHKPSYRKNPFYLVSDCRDIFIDLATEKDHLFASFITCKIETLVEMSLFLLVFCYACRLRSIYCSWNARSVILMELRLLTK